MTFIKIPSNHTGRVDVVLDVSIGTREEMKELHMHIFY